MGKKKPSAGTHRIKPGKRIRLEGLTTKGKRYCEDREAAEAEFHELRAELVELQRRFYAEGKHKLLILFQALDAGGKDGVIRVVLRGVNPQGVRVSSFKKPTAAERSRDYLWRVHREVPGAGMIGIFNRSHYEDVLVARVDDIVPEQVWRARYEQINQFEKLLADTGTSILKFYLHISRDEQRKRFQERLDDSEKHWKFSMDDLNKRLRWKAYMSAYEDAINECSTPWAPWHVIPADQKWYRNLAVARLIVGRLKQLDPRFPTSPEGIGELTIG